MFKEARVGKRLKAYTFSIHGKTFTRKKKNF